MSNKPPAVLYVDDELANRHAFQLSFEENFRVVTASSGKEALEILASDGNVGVLLTDQRMPVMQGSQLCGVVRERYPEVVRMIATAFSDISAVVEAINAGQITRYFIKPWNEAELAAALQSALDVFALTRMTRDVQVRLLERERASAVAVLLGKVLQDIGGPLGNIVSNLGFLTDSVGQLGSILGEAHPEARRLSGEILPALEDARAEAAQIKDRVELLRQGDLDGRTNSPITLDRALVIAINMMRSEVSKRARLVVEMVAKPVVAAEQSKLTQVCVNLLMNACEAIPLGAADKHMIRVRTYERSDAAGFSVEDTGATIPSAQREAIFEPFAGRIPTGRGGLGLAIVREVVESLGGTVRAFGWETGDGSRFVVELPRVGM